MPLYLCFMLLVFVRAAGGILIEEPENTVALLNEITTIKCKSDNDRKLQWNVYENSSEKAILWSGYDLNPNACSCKCCQIDIHEPGGYNLKITATKETAKRYTCTEPVTIIEASASLIVIESTLGCTYSTAGSNVTLLCVIGFYGEWAPQLGWNDSDGEQMNEANVSVENGKVTSTLIMPLTYHIVYYTAYVYFNETDRPIGVTATNVPTYTDEWKSPLFKRETKVLPNYITAIIVVSCFLVGGIVFATVGLLLSRRISRYLHYSRSHRNVNLSLGRENIRDNGVNQGAYRGQTPTMAASECRVGYV